MPTRTSDFKDVFVLHQDDKCLRVSGPAEMEIKIDYDDVWHRKVMHDAERLVELLNRHWDE